MDIGSMFLLVVLLLVVGGGLLYGVFGVFGVSGKRAEKHDAPTSDDPEANARFEKGEQPEHTRVK
ncbi:MAG TPA: hypothetical protein VIL49_01830, partial [Capillimicrobium sp.]